MESMINLFNRHKEAGTCGFASWCDFVAWLHTENPDKSKLGELKELSAKAYAATKPKTEKATPAKEAAEKETVVKEEPVKAVETVPAVEEKPKTKNRKPKVGE